MSVLSVVFPRPFFQSCFWRAWPCHDFSEPLSDSCFELRKEPAVVACTERHVYGSCVHRHLPLLLVFVQQIPARTGSRVASREAGEVLSPWPSGFTSCSLLVPLFCRRRNSLAGSLRSRFSYAGSLLKLFRYHILAYEFPYRIAHKFVPFPYKILLKRLLEKVGSIECPPTNSTFCKADQMCVHALVGLMER